MYKIEWDAETGGVRLSTRITTATLGIAPRPVFHEELDLIGLDKLGWSYPRGKEPVMWAVNKQYYHRGVHLFDAKGADIYTMPTLAFAKGAGEPRHLSAVDIEAMTERNANLMFGLESEAVEFIRDTHATYARANKAYDASQANQLDYEALARRAEKAQKRPMAVVQQDCESFDVVPLDSADGKRALLSTKIDRFIASFSGGKDSQVVLDLCTRAIPPTAFSVIYSDTGYELPPSLRLYDQVREHYQQRFPSLRFDVARNHESVLNYWDRIGTPSDTHRWCCSIMKTAPLYRMLKTEGNKQARTLTFDGVRAEESTRREGYERLGKGKHTFIYNAHPILQWNAVEIFLYIFGHDLPINPAYRQGKARVGCVTCPFSTPWDDMVINACYADDLRPFVDKLKLYAEQVKLHGIDSFVKDRRWKLKPLANRTLVIPQVQFKGNASAIEFEAVLTDARMPLTAWLPAIGKHSLQVTADGIKGDLQYKKVIYPYEVHEKGNTTTFKLTGKLTSELTFLLRRYIYKTAYCINCEVCEVDCPTGALSILPNINIDKDKCIHCHKCFNSHDRGCVVADCTRMVNDTERKLNAKIQGYKTFGMREDWIDEFFSLGDDFWTSNSLGTAQQDSFKAWLRDAEITDIKYRLTPLGEVMKEIFGNDPTLFWEIAFINLSYNSFIVQWFCSNVAAGVVYNKKYLKEEVLNSGVAGSAATIENAAGAFVDMAKRSPIGEDLKQGTDMGKEGLCRGEHANVSLEAVAYSLYRYGKERGASLLRVSDLYSATEGHGLYKEFRISKEELHKKLRTLSSDANRVLVAELNMGLEHITLREDLTALTALKALI